MKRELMAVLIGVLVLLSCVACHAMQYPGRNESGAGTQATATQAEKQQTDEDTETTQTDDEAETDTAVHKQQVKAVLANATKVVDDLIVYDATSKRQIIEALASYAETNGLKHGDKFFIVCDSEELLDERKAELLDIDQKVIKTKVKNIEKSGVIATQIEEVLTDLVGTNRIWACELEVKDPAHKSALQKALGFAGGLVGGIFGGTVGSVVNTATGLFQ